MVLFIAYCLLTIGFSYCASLILIGFPCTIWEAIAKRKIDEDKQDKVIRIATICLSVVGIWRLFGEFVLS